MKRISTDSLKCDYINCSKVPYENEYVTIAVESQFKQNSPKKRFFGLSTGFEPVASAFALQCCTS